MAPGEFPVAYPALPNPPSHRDAVINAFVFVHQSLHQANSRLSKRGGRTMAITPRHYLDFINHFVSTVRCFNSLPDDKNFRLVQIETNCRRHFKAI